MLEGAPQLVGDWFPDAYGDDARRAWGIAFPSVAERNRYEPGRRLQLARLGKLTPESAPLERQTWHTYPPVAMPSVDGVVSALTRPETWPDYASELGRFTPLRAGGLDGQTFEIEVAAGTESGRPIFTRGYVTITRLVTPDDPRFVATVEAIGYELRRGFHVMRYVAADDFGPPESAFLICRFWLVDALWEIGRQDEARDMFVDALSWALAIIA